MNIKKQLVFPYKINLQALKGSSQEELLAELTIAARNLDALMLELEYQRGRIAELEEKLAAIHANKQELMFLEGYHAHWTNLQVIRYILNYRKKAMSTPEIEADFIFLNTDRQTNLKDSYKAVANCIYQATIKNLIKRVNFPGAKGYFYALPEWLDENNVLKKRFWK